MSLTKPLSECLVASSEVSYFNDLSLLVTLNINFLFRVAIAMANVLAILVVMGMSVPLSLIAVIPLAYLYQKIMQYVPLPHVTSRLESGSIFPP